MVAVNTFEVANADRIGVITQAEIALFLSQQGVSGDSAKLAELISRRHPLYDSKIKHWEFLEETYEGGREWFEKHIFRYLKEGEKEFADRKERAYRFNHTREVVDLLNKHLFRQHINRNEDDAPPGVKKFWKRATRSGLSIGDFMRQVSKKSSNQGRLAIVVDSNKQGSGAVSVADEKKLKLGVFAYIVGPADILDYSRDDAGELNWILLRETYRADADPFDTSVDSLEVKSRYRLWTREAWFLIQQNSKTGTTEVVDGSTHELGEVPVILHDHIISDEEWCSPAMIDEVAYLDRAVANYLSNLDAIIQDQTFSQLVIPAQGLPDDKDAKQLAEIGTKRLFTFDAEGGMPPAYISPDPKQAQMIVTAIQKIINEIYHTVGLAGERTKEDNSVGIDNSSGVAKAYDFERVNAMLAAKADSLEVTENKINRLVALWNSETVDKDLTGYPDDFDTRSLYDEFDIGARLLLIEAPDEVRRQQMLAIIKKLFPMIGEAKLKELEGSVEDWPADPLEEAAAMAEIQTESAIKVAKAAPKPAAAKPAAKKATKNNRQGQVTKSTK